MEKRAILAIALSILVLFAFRYYFDQEKVQQSPGRAPATQYREKTEPPATPAPAPPAKASTPPQAPSGADTGARAQQVVVEGDIYRAVIDNRGALITSWELKKYKSSQGKVFEIIPWSQSNDGRSIPGALFFQDPATTSMANKDLYEVTTDGAPDGSSVLTPPVTVNLKLKRGDFTLEKRYRFDKDNYVVQLTANFSKAGKALEGEFLLGQDMGPEQEHLLSSSTKLEAVYYSDGKVRREGPPKNENDIKKIAGDIRWAGLEMQYFAMLAIPDRSFPFFGIQKRPISTESLTGEKINRDLIRLTLPVNGSLEYQVYLGPKKPSDLRAVKAADITGVINYGMFSFLVFPLLAALRWIHQFVHNYGWAIVILTFFLTLLLFPFRLKQMLSMKKMQVVQPKVKAIQEKYKRYKKTDPKRAAMNQEIMALYKEHNVNPLGGCLPMLLQLPLLFAFYSLLAYSIELRQAPFVGWIHDLSLKDPYYILPILMGISMFVSQKMTPMAPGTDPTQAKMMLLMPLVFTFMFLGYSSGLNLYFLCSNIFSVGFQKIAERYVGDSRSTDKPKSQ
jgi:YidC/Oxa1 family membrane protein insertase